MGRFSQAYQEDHQGVFRPEISEVLNHKLTSETPPFSAVQEQVLIPEPKKDQILETGNIWLETKIKLHTRLIDEIDLAQLDGLESEELREKVHIIVAEMAREDKLKMNAVELENLANGVYDEMVGLGPLEVLLQDETVSDILINTHERVFVERRGELELSAVRFANEPHLLRIINRIVSQAGRRVDESQPLCDCRLMDGSRVNVAIAPIAVDGPLVSIRKFSKSPLTLDRLVEYNAKSV